MYESFSRFSRKKLPYSGYVAQVEECRFANGSNIRSHGHRIIKHNSSVFCNWRAANNLFNNGQIAKITTPLGLKRQRYRDTITAIGKSIYLSPIIKFHFISNFKSLRTVSNQSIQLQLSPGRFYRKKYIYWSLCKNCIKKSKTVHKNVLHLWGEVQF